MGTGEAQVWPDQFKTGNYSSLHSYPGNSQRLLEVFPSNESESPGSGTLHHYPQRHRCRRPGRFLNKAACFVMRPSARSRLSVDDKCRCLRRATGALQAGEDPQVPLRTNGFRSSTADKAEHKDRLLV